MKIYLGFASIALLSACMGGTAADMGGTAADMGGTAVDDVEDPFLDRAQPIVAAFEDAVTEGFSPYSDLAVETGTAQYSGISMFTDAEILNDEFDTEVIYAALGDFEATADFGAAQSVTATADNFRELVEFGNIFEVENFNDVDGVVVGEAVEGSFTFDLAIVDFGDEAALEGTVQGSLTGTDDATITMDVTAFGEFFGPGLSAMSVSGGGIDDADTFEATIIGIGIRE